MAFEDFWRDLQQIRAARGRRAANLIAWRRTPSSHATARRLVEEYCSEDSTPPDVDIVALEQSAGRGREDRSWSSPAGAGLYASLVRSIPAETLPRLPLLVPVALAEALGDRTGGKCRIKWPNDLVADGRKLAGVLIDTKAQGERQAAVISFGVNVASSFEVFDVEGVTSIGALGEEPRLAALFEDLIAAVDRAVASAEGASALSLLERYRRLSQHREGDRLQWHQSGQVVEGIFRGFERDGRLRLEVDGSLELVAAGTLVESGDDAAV